MPLITVQNLARALIPRLRLNHLRQTGRICFQFADLLLVGPNAHIHITDRSAGATVCGECQRLPRSRLRDKPQLRDHRDGVRAQRAVRGFDDIHALVQRRKRHLGCLGIEAGPDLLTPTRNQLRAVQQGNLRKHVCCDRLALLGLRV